MTSKTVVSRLAPILLGLGLLASGPGCSTFWWNQTAERTGSFTVLFINDTPYRASFSYGVWDSLDRNPIGQMEFHQIRVEGHSSATPDDEVTCARNFALGTQELYDRALANDQHETAEFDPDAFDTVVHFSDQPADSDLAAAATVGTAAGFERLLGVDYTCGDQLIFTFVQDPDAEGGFRIDFAVIFGES